MSGMTPVGTASACTTKEGAAVEGENQMICAECMNGNSDCWEVSKKGKCVFSPAQNQSAECGEANTG
jgi:hypothetical protein